MVNKPFIRSVRSPIGRVQKIYPLQVFRRTVIAPPAQSMVYASG